MELIKDVCHWCELEISRPSVNLLWIDEYESADCEFHPASFDPSRLERTGETAPHQPIREVHKIIKEDFYRKKALREKQPLHAVEDNVAHLSKKATDTSAKAYENILPKMGSIRRQVYDVIKYNGNAGMTDSELEDYMKGKHQTVSSARRSLVIDGWLMDSGIRRKNAQGNECIVWIERYNYVSQLMLQLDSNVK